MNSTYIALIPKVPYPDMVAHLRPISLCNVCYKVITKIIVNRLKPLLKELVGPSQDSFCPGRFKTDNIIINQEMIHTMKRRKGKKGYVEIKVDLEKAYDRVRWGFFTANSGICGNSPRSGSSYHELCTGGKHGDPLEWKKIRTIHSTKRD